MHLKKTLHLATLRDAHILNGLLALEPYTFNHFHDIHAGNDVTEDDVLAVEMRCGRACDEKLATVGIGARVLRQNQERSVSVLCVMLGQISSGEIMGVTIGIDVSSPYCGLWMRVKMNGFQGKQGAPFTVAVADVQK